MQHSISFVTTAALLLSGCVSGDFATTALNESEHLSNGAQRKSEAEEALPNEDDIVSEDFDVVGGNTISIEDAPWQVHLKMTDNNSFSTCGGSILSKDWILTAAHCIDDFSASQTTVRAGSSFPQSGGTVHQAAELWFHPDYGNGGNSDIGLIRLQTSINLDGVKTKAIKLLTKELADAGWDQAGRKGNITGFGLLRTGAQGAAQLQGLDLLIASQQDSQQRLGYGISSGVLGLRPADFSKRGSCQGDSGGPFTVLGPNDEPLVAGVSSYTVNSVCASTGFSFYTRTSSFSERLAQVMGQIPAPQDPPPAPQDPAPAPQDPAPAPQDPAPAPQDPAPAPQGPTQEHARVGASLWAGQTIVYNPFRVAGSSNLNIDMTGSGDGDLYVSFNRGHDFYRPDCRPFGGNSYESCSMIVPPGGADVYIAVAARWDVQFQIDVAFTRP